MLLRKRSKPIPLLKLEVLIPRMPLYFKQLPIMQADLASRVTGYIGERKVDYQLRSLTRKYTILHDVYLELPYGNSVQIDSLILTPNAIFIIESKNYKGTITFDTVLKQLIRDDGEKETGFKYPITQAENHRIHLENWLHDHHFSNIPIYYFIAIAEPSTIVKVEGDKQAIAKAVVHAEYLPQRILEMDSACSRHNRGGLPVQKIANAILRECGEFDVDIMGQYGVTPEIVLPGVRCPECGHLGMERTHSNWYCPKCKTCSPHAHRQALATYLLLIRPWITNSECMRFLKIQSRNVATRLMKDTGLINDRQHRRWVIGTEYKLEDILKK
ncbi:nuclease-related domain-containing protein [Lentibacillus sp. N15]|uniref:nuclease-related domain-containing protein n=1 Tax=Lentibacillus songyuanensis TaxID=3136161 RepID=UPI0031BB25E1